MAEIDYNAVIAAMRKGDPGAKGDPGIAGTPGIGTTATAITAGTSFNSYINPGVYSWENTEATDGPPVASKYGTMHVTRSAGGARLTQTFYPSSSSISGQSVVFYQRVFLPGVGAFSWRTYASQRIDNTAGKAIYTWDDTTNTEQLIYGDTGWLDIATLFEVDWVVTSSIIRRVNNLVTINLEGIKCATPPSSNPAFFKPPVGFKPEVALNNSMGNQRVGYITELSGTNGKIISPENGGAGLRFLGYTANLTLHGSVMYYTRDPWPTTMPTPIAGIPGKPM